MTRMMLLSGAVLMLAGAAIAADQKAEKAPKAAPTEVKCPVEPEHKVNIADATKKKMFADYKGNRYFFCCAGCPGEFKKNPEKYAKSEHIPTPKDAK